MLHATFYCVSNEKWHKNEVPNGMRYENARGPLLSLKLPWHELSWSSLESRGTTEQSRRTKDFHHKWRFEKLSSMLRSLRRFLRLQSHGQHYYRSPGGERRRKWNLGGGKK